MGRKILLFLFLLTTAVAKAQLMYSESFTPLPFDSTQKMVGSLSGSLQSQKQKNLFLQFSERADFSMKVKGHYAVTLANSFDIIRDGRKTVMSGGYIFMRFYRNITRPVSIMYFAQYQWFAIRGLDQRTSGGPSLYFRLIHQPKQALHAGLGAFIEHEKWNYNAVPVEKLPAVTAPLTVTDARWNAFISYDVELNDRLVVDAAIYYQTGILPGFERTRIGSHTRLGWRITKHLRLFSELYTLFEYKTVVPIDPFWYRVNTNLSYQF